MKKKKFYFLLLVIVILGLTGFNIYLNSRGDIAIEKGKLITQNQQQKSEINKLLKQNEELQPSAQEQERRQIIDTASKFIETAYVQKEDGFDERKKTAQSLMTEDLFKRFYPSDNFYQKNIETDIEQPGLFLQTKYPEEKHANMIAHFKHELHEKQNNTTQKTKIYIEILLEKKDNKWMVTDLKDIYSEEE